MATSPRTPLAAAVPLAGVLLLLAVLLVVPVHPAAARASPCAPGQPPGRPPGEPRDRPGRPPTRPPQYPPGQCQLRLSRSAVPAGGEVTAAGEGYAPGSQVELRMAGRTLATASAAGDGTFVRVVVVPVDVRPGTYRMEAAGIAGTGGAHVLSSVLTVTAGSGGAAATAGTPGAAAQPAGRLPHTGTSSVTVTLAALILVALGAGLVAASRRR